MSVFFGKLKKIKKIKEIKTIAALSVSFGKLKEIKKIKKIKTIVALSVSFGKLKQEILSETKTHLSLSSLIFFNFFIFLNNYLIYLFSVP